MPKVSEAGKENFHSRIKSFLQSNLFSLDNGKFYKLTSVHVYKSLSNSVVISS